MGEQRHNRTFAIQYTFFITGAATTFECRISGSPHLLRFIDGDILVVYLGRPPNAKHTSPCFFPFNWPEISPLMLSRFMTAGQFPAKDVLSLVR